MQSRGRFGRFCSEAELNGDIPLCWRCLPLPTILFLGHNYGMMGTQAKRGEVMPKIIPIRDLKKTSELSEMCQKEKEPVFITKNGYGNMVIMSMETYEKTMLMNDIYRKVDEAEQSIRKGEVIDGLESLRETREKYEL